MVFNASLIFSSFVLINKPYFTKSIIYFSYAHSKTKCSNLMMNIFLINRQVISDSVKLF